jgi:hypothetical protein
VPTAVSIIVSVPLELREAVQVVGTPKSDAVVVVVADTGIQLPFFQMRLGSGTEVLVGQRPGSTCHCCFAAILAVVVVPWQSVVVLMLEPQPKPGSDTMA